MTAIIPGLHFVTQFAFMISKTKKTGLRKKMLDASTAKQQFLIDDFKERIRALTENEGLGNEESYDNMDQANNATNITEINALNEALEFANKELVLLENLRTTEDQDRNTAVLGAIVVTNHQTFFVSVSIEKFAVEGNMYVGISTSSPIFKAMRGMRKGETFSFKGVVYKIREIF